MKTLDSPAPHGYGDLRAMFDSERPYHDWSVSHFGFMLSPTIMVLLDLYIRHPQARRSVSAYWRDVERSLNKVFSIRPPNIRPRPATPFRGLDQKQLASGEKPDDD